MKRWFALLLLLCLALPALAEQPTPPPVTMPTPPPEGVMDELLIPTAMPAEASPLPTSVPAETPEATATPKPARGYVLVSYGSSSGWLPLPEEGEYTFPLTQVLADGTFTENVIHLTTEGVYMESSTCENQDCVHEGLVTFENRDSRVLGNMIICLPNMVALELYTWEEVCAMLQVNADE